MQNTIASQVSPAALLTGSITLQDLSDQGGLGCDW